MLEKERKELKYKKTLEMFMDPRTETTPYIDHYEERTHLESLMLAAYIVNTPGCHEMFVCKSCNKEVKDRQGFRKHSHTKLHLKNHKEWTKIVEKNNFEDEFNNTKRQISKAAITRAKEAIELEQDFHRLARNRFFEQCNDQISVQQVQEEEAQIEMIDLAQQINEQDLYAFNKATQAIDNLVPGLFMEFKRQVVQLISVMYFDKNKSELQIQSKAACYDAKQIRRHWIPKFYNNIKRRSDPRSFMNQQLQKEDLSFAEKSKEQLKEIKTICGMARLLFPIFCECQFVPNSYVIFLAVLMDTKDQIECDVTSTQLENGMIIDLLLRSGIAVLDPTTDVRPIIPTEPEAKPIHQDLIIPNQDDSPSHVHLPNAVWSNEIADSSKDQLVQEENFNLEQLPHTFLSSTGMDIESDLLLNQTRIQDDINLNGMKVTTETKEEVNPNWTLNPDIYQKSYSSYSSTNSIQSLPGQDVIDTTIEEHDYYLDNEEAMDHESNSINVIEDNAATICIPNLHSDATEKSLKKLFKTYGQIKDIIIESSNHSRFRNGLITFVERCNAVSAMISMNNTAYKQKKFNIVMSKKKIKRLRDYQNRMEETPLENLTSMVQNITGEPNSLNMDPEAEIEISNMNPKQDTVITTLTTKPTKKTCKRKIKSNWKKDTTKSSKSDIDTISKETQSEILVEIEASSSEEHSEEGVEIHNEFKLQCSVSSPPPDPIYLAHCLFAHWERQLNFYEDVDRTNNGAFTMEAINHLAILVNEASSHRQME